MRSNLIVLLREILAEEHWNQVISALRQDVLVWEALEDASFRDAAIEQLGSKPEAWSPANLALLKLNIAPNTPIQQIPTELITKIENTYQMAQSSEDLQSNLENAGLLALALHKHADDWPTLPFRTPWSTALACLYGWLPGESKFVKALPLAHVIHIALANPLDQQQQLDLLSTRLAAATIEEQQTSLQIIAAQRPRLAATLANMSLIETGNHYHSKSKKLLSGAVLLKAQKQALSSEFEQARLSYDEVIETASQIKNNAVLSAAEVEIRSGRPDQALARWEEFSADPLSAQNAQLALTFIDHNFFEEADKILPSSQPNNLPITQIAISRLYSQQGDIKTAREILELLLAKNESADELIKDQWHQLLAALIEADLSREVIRLAPSYLIEHPNDVQTIQALAQAQQIAGTIKEALSYAQLSVALAPKNVVMRRALAKGLEADGQWETAITEHNNIIRQQIEPLASDSHALANGYLTIGKTQQAVEICEQALLYNPQDGLAHTMFGKALLDLNQRQKAHEHFETAKQLAPELPDHWIALAEDQLQVNDDKTALQTLKTASRAIPHNPKILLTLGDTYQRQGASTKALKAYRRAAELSGPSRGNAVQAAINAKIVYALGTTLKDLGHKSEAQQVFEDAYAAMPAKSAIAHAYGQMLFEQGQANAAIEPLALSAQNDPKNPNILLDYAEALLCAGTQPQEAENTLSQLLALDPDHFQAKALFAEALEANGKKEAALDAFNLALNIKNDQQAVWQTRLISGLGRVALDLGQVETALAALEEARDLSPKDPIIAKMLTEAFKINHLPQKALEMAKTTLNLAPTNIEMLVWYTDFLTEEGFSSDAITLLDQAISDQPDQPELYLHQGKLHLEDNNPIAAQQSLAKIIQINSVSPEHLNHAADGLVACQNYTDAAACLVRALELNNGETHLQENTDTKKQLNFELLTQLTNAYHLSGESQLAIEAIDQALTIKPAQAPLIQQKGNLLLKLGHTKMAAEWNMSALEEIPDNADLRLQAAHIQRALGNLSAALEFANESYHLAQQSQDQCCSLDSVILAADLHIAMMNNDQALELLNQHGDLASSLNTDAVSNFYCMLGELAIRNNEEIAAANVLTKALSLDENHPRALALKARMKRRQGDLNAGSKALETSLEGFGGIKQMHNAEISSYVALAETALEYQAWSTAIFLLEEAAKIAPEEPLSYILLAQTLVQQAEYQHLYRTLNVDRHGQGDSALSKESYQRYDQAVLTASRLVEALQSNDIHSALSTYLVRGQAIFKPDAEHAKALLDIAPTADNLAAYLTILRASNNKKEAAQAALEIYQRDPMPTDPFLLSQIALVLIRKAPKIASSAAQQTVDESIRSHSPNPGLYLALQAYVAHRVEDHVTHLEAVETLLTHWEDEPDWHARAADLLINQQNLFGDNALEQAVTHLQKATQLAPRKEIFQLKLGEAYLHLGNSTDAITALEKAIQLDPDSIQSQLMLAKAVHKSGNHHQAKKIAEQIAKREPNDHGSSLLLAKLTIQENKAETALQYLDHVLQLKPQHPEALLTKAEALSMLGSYPEALTIFETAMVRQPQSSELRLEHVDLVKIVHGKQTALETLEKYNEQYPDDIPLQIRLGDALAENGHREEAIICAQRTMKLDDLLTINQKAQILKLLGSLLRQSGQLDQAITHLNNAVEQDPQWSEPYIELGRTYQQRRQYDRALDSYQQAIDLDPANPQAYHRAGMVLKDSKDYINAEQMLRKAATLDSKDIGIQRKLAAMIALNLVHQTNQPSTQPTTP